MRCWGVWLPRHIWDVENSQVRILSPQPKVDFLSVDSNRILNEVELMLVS